MANIAHQTTIDKVYRILPHVIMRPYIANIGVSLIAHPVIEQIEPRELPTNDFENSTLV